MLKVDGLVVSDEKGVEPIETTTKKTWAFLQFGSTFTEYTVHADKPFFSFTIE